MKSYGDINFQGNNKISYSIDITGSTDKTILPDIEYVETMITESTSVINNSISDISGLTTEMNNTLLTLTGSSSGNFVVCNMSNGGSVYSEDSTSSEYDSPSAIDVRGSIILGKNAGRYATNAYDSNFIGQNAGNSAINAYLSNFFGNSAGQTAVESHNSNFIGQYAGANATNAYHSNFFGTQAGQLATDAQLSTFMGFWAGMGATSAANSNFIGFSAGNGAANASNSIFIGTNAGQVDTVNNTGNLDDFSILIGKSTSTGGFSNSIAIGGSATNTKSNELMIGSTTRPINYLGIAGLDYTLPTTNVAGNLTNDGNGILTWAASSGDFVLCDNNTDGSIYSESTGAIKVSGSIFLGKNTGADSSGSVDSVFLGRSTGNGAINAYDSNFIGRIAGMGSNNASNSNFFGTQAGRNSTNARNSIFIGTNAGYEDTVNNTGNDDDFSILIGKNTNTGGFSNSIAIGGSAVNTAANQLMIGSSSRPINYLGIAGLTYSLPTSNVSGVLTNDGAGVLTWAASSGGGGDITVNVSNNAIYSGTIGAIDVAESIFLGQYAGSGATNAEHSNFFGNSAGIDADGANYSNFLGRNAGAAATFARRANFMGYFAGNGATSASYSNFFGNNAGNGAANACNSIFIGANAGQNDNVNNTGNVNDFSILIGYGTGTGGFSNSIAIGCEAVNTGSNQLMIGSVSRPINDVRIVGGATTLYFDLNSVWAPTPTSAGAVGQIIILDGYIYMCTGAFTWVRTKQETTW